MTTKCILIVCSVIVAIAIYWPARHARRYDYIEPHDIYNELLFTQLTKTNPNLKNCDYKDVILKNSDAEIETVTEPKHFSQPEDGGEYAPKQCNPLLKVAVIVPYRNRSQQLNVFLNYMHSFLQKQRLFYRIFIVDQSDHLPFNRAKMLNYGAKVAMDMGYPCLVLHDVDLLPLNSGNIYGCYKKPRHLSCSLDTFRFNLPYLTLFGGVVSISSQHFQNINGLSNQFYGWGGEDDDFYRYFVFAISLFNIFYYFIGVSKLIIFCLTGFRPNSANTQCYSTKKRKLVQTDIQLWKNPVLHIDWMVCHHCLQTIPSNWKNSIL